MLARWGLFTALGLVGGRGHGDICNWPGSPLLEPILGQLGSPRGAIQRQDQAQQGLQGLAQGPPAQRMAPEASACERRVGIYCILSWPLKHICWALPNRAFLGPEGSRLCFCPGQPHKAIPTQHRHTRNPSFQVEPVEAQRAPEA